MRPIVLAIGGSDSSGGAGLSTDVATAVRLGAHPAVAVTAVTAQRPVGVVTVHRVPANVVGAQIAAVLGSLPVAAVKIGLLATREQVAVIADALRAARDRPLVVLDPVLRATSGEALADSDVAEAIRTDLLPRATLVTPNLAEATALAARSVRDIEAMVEAGHRLVEAGAGAALVTGGHLPVAALDVLVADGRVWELEAQRHAGAPVRGTGCALAMAIAVRLAYGARLLDAVRAAKAWLTPAIEAAMELGDGVRCLTPPGRYADIDVRERAGRKAS